MKKLYSIVFLFIIAASCSSNRKTTENNKDTYIIDKYSRLLEISKSEIKNIKLYSFIDNWYGTKYKYGGMSKAGVDCSGFCNVLFKEVYNKEIKRTTSDLVRDINKKSKRNLSEGDLVFFNISKKKNSHVGVYLKNNRFAHASTSKGVLISSMENPYYKKAYNKGGSL